MSPNSRTSLTHKGIIGVLGLLFFGSGAVLAGNYAVRDYNTAIRVNESRISKSDVARRTLQLQPFFKSTQLSPEDQKKYVNNELVERELLVQAAKAAGLSTTEAEVDTEWKQLISAQYNGDTEAFERDLKRSSYTPRLFREELAERILSRQMRTKIQQNISPGEDELKAYYEVHKQDYMAPERVSAQHILFHIDEEQSNGEAKALQKARQVLALIQAGQNFATLAKAHSDDTTNNEKGGQLPLFSKGEMVEAFEKAVWPMKPGEVSSAPVKTDFGYHLILRGKTYAAGPKPFEEARPIFEERLKLEAQEKAVQSWLKSQKQAASIEPPLGALPELSQKNQDG